MEWRVQAAGRIIRNTGSREYIQGTGTTGRYMETRIKEKRKKGIKVTGVNNR